MFSADALRPILIKGHFLCLPAQGLSYYLLAKAATKHLDVRVFAGDAFDEVLKGRDPTCLGVIRLVAAARKYDCLYCL